jgi:hypothetical protein
MNWLVALIIGFFGFVLYAGLELWEKYIAKYNPVKTIESPEIKVDSELIEKINVEGLLAYNLGENQSLVDGLASELIEKNDKDKVDVEENITKSVNESERKRIEDFMKTGKFYNYTGKKFVISAVDHTPLGELKDFVFNNNQHLVSVISPSGELKYYGPSSELLSGVWTRQLDHNYLTINVNADGMIVEPAYSVVVVK